MKVVVVMLRVLGTEDSPDNSGMALSTLVRRVVTDALGVVNRKG